MSIQTIHKCYVIHNPAHKEREPFIEHTQQVLQQISSCSSLQSSNVWLQSGSELSESQLACFANKPISINHFKNACSLTYHHMHCLQDFISSNEPYAIVLEDDVFINSASLLQSAFSYIQALPYFDTVYLGDGCQPDIYQGQPAGCILTPWSRCTEAMLYSRAGAEKVLAYFASEQKKKCAEPQLDFFFNKAYKEMKDFKNFHVHPAPISQATAKHFMQSTINY
jgi:hypothetical protein